MSPVEIGLPFALDAPALARQFLNQHATQLSDSLRADAELLVSEIVTNSVLHGRPSVTMQIRDTPPGIIVSVSDEGLDLPTLPDGRPDTSAPSGRGLLIVTALAHDWGVTQHPDAGGKTVWFELGQTADRGFDPSGA